MFIYIYRIFSILHEPIEITQLEMPLDVVSSHEPYKPLYIVLCCQKMLLLGSAVPVN